MTSAAMPGLDAIPELPAPLWDAADATISLAVGPVLPHSVRASLAEPVFSPGAKSRGLPLHTFPRARDLRGEHAHPGRNAGQTLQDTASQTASLSRPSARNSAADHRIAGMGIDTSEVSEDSPPVPGEDAAAAPLWELTEERIRQIARHPHAQGSIRVVNRSGRFESMHVLAGIPRDKPVLQLELRDSRYAAKFPTYDKLAVHELTMLRAIDEAYTEDGIAQALPGFRVQRVAPADLMFTNAEGRLTPAILSEWMEGESLSSLTNDRDARSKTEAGINAVRMLHERLQDLEASDFWKGMEWLASRGFAIVDLREHNVMVSLTDAALTVFDFESVLRRPADPADEWNQTRFTRAARGWKTVLRNARRDLEERVAQIRRQ